MIDWWLGGEMSADGSLSWTSPQWAILLATAGGIVAWAAALLGSRPWASRLSELAFWALALFGLVVALAGPVWVEEEGRTEDGRIAVLVDGSRSMSILEDGKPRHESVTKVLEHLDATAEGYEVYHFGDDLVIGPPDEYDLSGTDLEGALDALSERAAGERLAAVVAVTDGLDRGLLRRRFKQEETPAPPNLPGPLTVFQIGALSDVKDLAVRSVDAGGFAFIRSPFRIRAEIEGIGFAGRSVPATLEVDGAPVTTKNVQLDDDGYAEAVFEVTAEDAGRFTYGVSVPVYEGDAVPANNTMPVVVRVVRDRIRVLQVAGAPSWDVKFLRRFLKGDPSIQLVSFFILRTQRDLSTAYDDTELSLIQFPYRRLFDEDLWSFDVVVFQNFDYYPYFQFDSPLLLDNLRKYVEDGGALVMIGGDRSFGLGDYGGTALAEVLPVQLANEGGEADPLPFSPLLTEVGARHPVTRLTLNPAENAEWWSRLHAMDGTNVVLGPTPDAAVLLSHPTRKTARGEPLPILAVREAGLGRTMALTVDASWRWSLAEAAEGRGNQAYLRFWKNAIRWLMKDTTFARVTVDTPRENYAVGDEVRIVVRVRDPGFAALQGAKVKVVVVGDGKSSRMEGRTDSDGEVVLTFPAERRGTHRVKVSVGRKSETIGTAQTVFAVTTRDPELDEVAPDSAFLRWLAERTDGQYFDSGELGAVLVDPAAGRVVWDRRETPLWQAPVLAMWIGLFGGFAWLVRRRSGLR